jgi:hypothetical protein
MLHKLAIYIILIAIFLQAGWDALAGLWFFANQQALTEQHCINRYEPELMCHGKCYLQEVLEEQHQQEEQNPVKIPPYEERLPFLVLPLFFNSYKGAAYSDHLLRHNFYYGLPAGRLLAFSFFHPPRGC